MIPYRTGLDMIDITLEKWNFLRLLLFHAVDSSGSASRISIVDTPPPTRTLVLTHRRFQSGILRVREYGKSYISRCFFGFLPYSTSDSLIICLIDSVSISGETASTILSVAIDSVAMPMESTSPIISAPDTMPADNINIIDVRIERIM